MKARDYKATHFCWSVGDDGVATLTLNRPERKNPLTFDSYAEMRDLFRALIHADDCKVVIVTGAGGNFSSGGDVHEIIGPLTEMDMPALLAFTRMTGDLVKAMRGCPQPVITALDGVCVGAGVGVGTPATWMPTRSRSPKARPAASCICHEPPYTPVVMGATKAATTSADSPGATAPVNPAGWPPMLAPAALPCAKTSS